MKVIFSYQGISMNTTGPKEDTEKFVRATVCFLEMPADTDLNF